MMMLTKENRASLPALYATENVPLEDKVLAVKFFQPWGAWTWYAAEFDGADQFFGYVDGHEGEWGYFSLAELSSIKGPFGLKIERDRYWQPVKFSVLHPVLAEGGQS